MKRRSKKALVMLMAVVFAVTALLPTLVYAGEGAPEGTWALVCEHGENCTAETCTEWVPEQQEGVDENGNVVTGAVAAHCGHQHSEVDTEPCYQFTPAPPQNSPTNGPDALCPTCQGELVEGECPTCDAEQVVMNTITLKGKAGAELIFDLAANGKLGDDANALDFITAQSNILGFKNWLIDSTTAKTHAELLETPFAAETTVEAVFDPVVTLMIGENQHSQIVATDGVIGALTAPDKSAYPAGAVSFRGWYTTPNTGGDRVDTGARVTADTTLFARFSDKYLISYKDGDGSIKETKEVTGQEAVYRPSFTPVSTEANMQFVYWAEEGSQTQYVFGATTDRDLVLVPIFSNEHYVYFISEGSQVTPQRVVHGHNARQPANPERQGYTFRYWSTEPGGAEYKFAQNTVTSNLALYAVWQATSVKYSVVYWVEKPNFDGSVAAPGVQPTDAGTDPDNYMYHSSATSNSFTAPAGSVVTSVPGLKSLNHYYYSHVVSSTIQGNGTSVVNVYYKLTVYNLTFNVNESWGFGITGKMVFKNDSSNHRPGQTFTDSQYSFKAKFGQDLEKAWPSSWNANITGSGNLTSYVFQNWNDRLVSKRFTLTQEIVTSGGSNSTGATGNLSFGAIHTSQSTSERKVEYWLEVLPGESGGTYKTWLGGSGYFKKSDFHSQTLTMKTSEGLSAKDIEGYDSVKTESDVDGVFRKFYYTRYNFTLIFNGNESGVTNVPGNKTGVKLDEPLTSYEPNKASQPRKTGSTFTQWFYEPECKTPVNWAGDVMPNMADKKLTVYAGWESSDNTVRFYDRQGSLGGASPLASQGVANGKYVNQEAALGYAITVEGVQYILTPPTGDVPGTQVPGYGEFLGWNWLLDGTQPTSFSFDMPINADYDLYANWRTDGYKVNYLNGTDTTGAAPEDGKAYRINTGTRVLDNGTLAKEDEVFIGWMSSMDNRLYYTGETMLVLGDTEMSPVFGMLSNYWKVTFKAGYENSGQDDVVWYVPKNSPDLNNLLSRDHFTRENHVVTGWKQVDPAGNTYLPTDSYTVEQDTVFEAVWADGGHTIKFVAGNGGRLEEATVNKPHTYSEIPGGTLWDAAITGGVPQAIADPGHYFVGWEPAIPAGTAPIDKSQTYEAKFAATTPITIKADSDNKTYDGTPLTKGTATVTSGALIDGDELVVTMASTSTITDVGTVDNVIATYAVIRGSSNVTGGYAVSTEVGELKVTAKEVTLTANSNDVATNVFNPLNPQPYSASNYTAAPANWLAARDSFTGLDAYGEQVLPGSAAVKFQLGASASAVKLNDVELTFDPDAKTLGYPADYEGAKNYQFTLVEGTVKVYAPAAGSLQWSVTGVEATKTYNGAGQTNTNAADKTYTVNLPAGFTLANPEKISATGGAGRNVNTTADGTTPAQYNQAITVGDGWKINYTSGATVLDATDWFKAPAITNGWLKISPAALTVKPVVTITDPINELALKALTATPAYEFSYADLLGDDSTALITDVLNAAPAIDWDGLDTHITNKTGYKTAYTFGVANKAALKALYGNYTLANGTQGLAVTAGNTLTYNANGLTATGMPTPNPQPKSEGVGYVQGDLVPISTTTPTAEGWVFKGWSTEQNYKYGESSTDTFYAAGSEYTFTAADVANGAVVYAVWAPAWEETPDAVGITGFARDYNGQSQAITVTNTANWPVNFTGDKDVSGEVTADGIPMYKNVKRNATTRAVEDYNITATFIASYGDVTHTTTRTAAVRINPVKLAYTFSTADLTYGDEAPTLALAPAGDVAKTLSTGAFVGAESESLLTFGLTFTTNYEKGKPAGTYNLSASGNITADNYDVTYSTETFTVKTADVPIIPDIPPIDLGEYDLSTEADFAKVYGQVDPDFTVTWEDVPALPADSGLAPLEDTIKLSRADTSENTGVYQLAANLDELNETYKDYYTFTFDGAYFEILPRPVDAVAAGASMTYGNARPSSFDYRVDDSHAAGLSAATGLADAAWFTALGASGRKADLARDYAAAPSYEVVNYTTANARRSGHDYVTDDIGIRLSLNEPKVSNNYQPAVQEGTLTVNRRALSITANSGDTYTLPGPFTVTGYQAPTNLARGDTLSGLSASGTANTEGTHRVTFNVRANQVTIRSGGANVAFNYAISLNDGSFVVNAAAPVVPPDGGVPVVVVVPVVPAPAAPVIVPPAAPAPTVTVPVPAVPFGPAETQELEQQETPQANLPQQGAPQANIGTWALLNLILAILYVILAVVLIIGIFQRNRKKDEQSEEAQENGETERNRKSGMGWRIFSIIVGILSPIAFILTENIRLEMIFVDRWTLLMVIILAVQVIGMLLLKRARNQEDKDDDEKQTPAQA